VLRHEPLSVSVRFLAPLDPAHADRRQLAERAHAAIAGALGLAANPGTARPRRGADSPETPAPAGPDLVPAE